MERNDILRIEDPASADDPNSPASGPLRINDAWPGFYLRGVMALEVSGNLLRWIGEAKRDGKEIPPGLELLATSMRRCAVGGASAP